MNNKRGFSLLGLLLVVVIIAGVVVVGYDYKKKTPVAEVSQNETVGTDVAKQCASDKDCAYNSTCGWGRCIRDTSVTDKTSRGGSTTTIVPDTATVSNSKTVQASTITPKSKTEFSLDRAVAVTFVWAPASGTAKPVTYRMKVWQLMQGQNGSTAMRSNQPIVTKDVDNVTSTTVSGIWTGPCKPPYLCAYVWDVETITNGSPAAGASTNIGSQSSSESAGTTGTR
jgi:Tfp pilus assembly major pilin PilA